YSFSFPATRASVCGRRSFLYTTSGLSLRERTPPKCPCRPGPLTRREDRRPFCRCRPGPLTRRQGLLALCIAAAFSLILSASAADQTQTAQQKAPALAPPISRDPLPATPLLPPARHLQQPPPQ